MAINQTAGRPRRRSAEAWRSLIEEWQQSGLELIQFCRERRIPPSNLKWWRWRLGIPAEKGPRLRKVPAPTTSPVKQDWIQLEIQTPHFEIESAPFELRWPDGRILAIPPRFDMPALSRLLALLERSPC
jgi:hypothetical protein